MLTNQGMLREDFSFEIIPLQHSFRGITAQNCLYLLLAFQRLPQREPTGKEGKKGGAKKKPELRKEMLLQ